MAYLPTFTINLSHMQVNIPVPWILWKRDLSLLGGYALPGIHTRQIPWSKKTSREIHG